jgi:hypothetical protein
MNPKNVKFVVTVPISHADIIRETLGKIGAGKIGNYDFCSFSVSGDAISMDLPLLGHDEGDTSGHDWNNLLVMLGILKYTPMVEKVFVFLGYAVYSLGLVIGILGVIYNSKKDYSNE